MTVQKTFFEKLKIHLDTADNNGILIRMSRKEFATWLNLENKYP